MKEINSLELIGSFGARIDAPARDFLNPNHHDMYGMMRYFMGYTDEHFAPVAHPVGKRIRPGLLLYIAEQYGLIEKALPVALSIELFHNFTLIHDDIVDHDELRRGRPTVWKLWGVDHAINTGDAQLVLALRALESSAFQTEAHAGAVRSLLLGSYLEVIEGQYLDFTLAATALGNQMVSEKAYLEMIRKKSAVLIRASCEAAAVLAGHAPDTCLALGAFGENLGMAYQLYDDWQSMWGTSEKTGKEHAGDIRERKKTLPIIYAHNALTKPDQQQLEEIYNSRSICEADISTVLELLGRTRAKETTEQYAIAYKQKAIDALLQTGLPADAREVLEGVARTLVPDSISDSR